MVGRTLVALAVAVTLVASAFDSSSVAAGRTWHVVVLGDSGASGRGDPTGLGWGGRYGQLLTRDLGVGVVVTNLAREGKSSGEQLAEVRSDPTTRAALKNADVILLGSTAGAALNAADERLQARQCRGETCYATALHGWRHDYEQIVISAVALGGTRKTVLRGVTEPNVVPGAKGVVPSFATVTLGLYQAKLIRTAVCATMKAHHGRCIDVLTALNGASGTQDAYRTGLMNKVDCCYPSGKGQQLIAKLLLESGLD